MGCRWVATAARPPSSVAEFTNGRARLAREIIAGWARRPSPRGRVTRACLADNSPEAISRRNAISIRRRTAPCGRNPAK